MAKRKAEALNGVGASFSLSQVLRPQKRQITDDNIALSVFSDDLFDHLERYKEEYLKAKPYKHLAIPSLVQPSVLREVRKEILENISFSPKETDIYKIHQSGDLANLDGLSDEERAHLPTLVKLRDAIYSQQFRDYVSAICGCGPLSAEKKDLAINTYLPGCHLLCHDDVIGSRRVSYILYLTDPDTPWKAEWGGALRLYPTKKALDGDGKEIIIPSPDVAKTVPPAWNQLSFFEVQPGYSFHDVEEVYSRETDKVEDDGGRMRMTIIGWFHIPQKGEDGYVKGLEEEWVKTSSLGQLQAKASIFDMPLPQVEPYDLKPVEESDNKGKGKVKTFEEEENDAALTEEDFDFLLRFISPNYLTPDVALELLKHFGEESSLRLNDFLNDKFSSALREHIEKQESQSLPTSYSEIEATTPWNVARPPHKCKYLYQQRQSTSTENSQTPIQSLLEELLPSIPFKKWLSLITGCKLTSNNVLARRFRRGIDYTLATALDNTDEQLEITLDVTPTKGWGEDIDVDVDGNENSESNEGVGAYEISSEVQQPPLIEDMPDDYDVNAVGGYGCYMVGDENDDPAVYNSTTADGDDGILLSVPAGWNRLSVVLRDHGVLRFVKYISRAAKGDRWDLVGEYGVEADHDEDSSD